MPTAIATVYRGPDDPAIDFDPQPGDIWVQTGLPVIAGYQPTPQHVRNATGGWDAAGLAVVVAGKVRATVKVTPEPGVYLQCFDADGGEIANAIVGGDGSVTLTSAGATLFHTPGDGSVLLGGPFGPLTVPNLPTTDPAYPGALWNDAGTVKVSAG